MNGQVLIDLARTLVGSGRGLLAIDESTTTCNSGATPRTRAGIAQHPYL
jgi:fructose-bisphosphate aldolase class 1